VVVAIIVIGIPSPGSDSLPPYFSWRDVNGVDYTTPVKNQEPCPSCEAYALVAILETLVQYKVGYPFNCDLSEAHLFFCSGGTCKWGVDIGEAANYIVEHGVPDEGCFPELHRRYDMPCNLTIDGWENRSVKVKGWGVVENNVESIKKALIQHGPLAACINVWEDFYHYHGGIYRHKWGRRIGGHVITVVGYDDRQGCWICKNSWGKEWGEGGWFRAAYDSGIFMDKCYSNYGLIYLEGVYGNLMPDVPKVYIERPRRYHGYIFGFETPDILGRIFKIGMPFVFGDMDVLLNASNTVKVEFYIDGKLQNVDTDFPFEWEIHPSPGLHEIKVFAYSDNGNMSWAGIDFFQVI